MRRGSLPGRRTVLVAAFVALSSLAGMWPASADNSVTYQYDQVGRVTSITDADGVTTQYYYDLNGNLTQQVVTTTGQSVGPTVVISSPAYIVTAPMPPGSSPSLSQSSTLVATGSGGTGTLSYTWQAVAGSATNSGTGTGITIANTATGTGSTAGSTTDTATLTSTCNGSTGCDFVETFQVTVSDSANPANTKTATAVVEHKYTDIGPTVAIASPGLTVTATMPAGSPSTLSLNSTLVATGSGGTGALSYSWQPIASSAKNSGPGTGIGIANTATGVGSTTGSTTDTANLTSTCNGSGGCDFVETFQVTVTDSANPPYTAIATANVEHKYNQSLGISLVSSSTQTTELPAGASPSAALSTNITANVTGGTAPLTYKWQQVGTSPTSAQFTLVSAQSGAISATPQGVPLQLNTTCATASGCDDTVTYALTVTDANSNMATASINVQHNYIVALTLSQLAPVTQTLSMPASAPFTATQSSTITGIINGGIAPITYSWTATQTPTGFAATGTNAAALVLTSTCSQPPDPNTELPDSGCDYKTAWTLSVTDSATPPRAATASVNVEHVYPLAQFELSVVPTPPTSTSSGETGTAVSYSPLSLLENGTITANSDGQNVSLSSYVTVETTGGTAPYYVTWAQAPANFWIPNGTTQATSTSFQFQSTCVAGTPGGCDYKGVMVATVADSSSPQKTGIVSVALEHKYAVGPATPPLTINFVGPNPNTASITGAQGASFTSQIYATVTGGVPNSTPGGGYAYVNWVQLSGPSVFSTSIQGTTNYLTSPPTPTYILGVSSSCAAGTVAGCDDVGVFELQVMDNAGAWKYASGYVVQNYIEEQGPLYVVNPGFEAVTLNSGSTSAPIPSWVENCTCSTIRPTSDQVPNGLNEGVNALQMSQGSISQKLIATIQPNTTYTLQVDIGQRADQSFDGYTTTLMAGSTVLGTDNNALVPQAGGLVTSTVTYYASASDPNIGQPLGVVLAVGTSGQQTIFDDVRVTGTPGQVVEFGALAITDPSFEAVSLSAGATAATAPGWTQNCSCVVYHPTATQFPSGPTNGVNVLAAASGSASQLIAATIQPNTFYALQVDIGQRADEATSGYLTSLTAGSVTLAADNNTLSPAPGSFITSTVWYYASPIDPNIGKPLSIVLAAGTANKQTEFDNVRLTAIAGPVNMIGVIDVPDPSFEAVALAAGGTSARAPGWSESCSCVVYRPTATQFPRGASDGLNVLAVNSGSASQQLLATLQPNVTYALQVDIGQRADASFAGYTSALVAGSTTLADDHSAWLPAAGTFATSGVYYYASPTDPNLGKPLTIVLSGGTSGTQTDFDNVRLTTFAGNILAVPITDPGFESAVIPSGDTSTTNIPGWTLGPPCGACAVGQSNSNQTLFMDGGSASQQLSTTVQPNTTYKLQVDIGEIEGTFGSNYTISLNAGSSTLVSDNNGVTLSSGGFVTSTITWYASATDPHIGQPLTIVLSDVYSPFGELLFDNVRMTATPNKVNP